MPQSPMVFDPNQPASSVPKWATYLPGRSPNFKLHSRRAYAFNAFQRPGILFRYDFTSSRWIEVYREERLDDTDPPLRCDACGITAKEAEDKREAEFERVRQAARPAGLPPGRSPSAVTSLRFYRREYDALRRVWVDKDTDFPRRVHVCREHVMLYR